MLDYIRLWEAQVDAAFCKLQKPTDEHCKLLGKDNPQEWRDRYFFNNGVKAMASSCRKSLDKKDKEIRELKLKIQELENANNTKH